MNEAIFRQVNEEIRSLSHEFGTEDGMITVICECGDSQCADRIGLHWRSTSASAATASST